MKKIMVILSRMFKSPQLLEGFRYIPSPIRYKYHPSFQVLHEVRFP
jgi:hypothetical protein